MAQYLISFPSAAMVVSDGELGAVGRDAQAVIEEAKAAGVYVFAGGIDEGSPPIRVSADGAVATGGYRTALEWRGKCGPIQALKDRFATRAKAAPGQRHPSSMPR